MERTITMNVKTKEYTNRVLGVIKEKYGLKDKGEALDKFAEMYGDEFADREVREEVIKEMLEECDKHIKKYGFRGMTNKQFEELFRGD